MEFKKVKKSIKNISIPLQLMIIMNDIVIIIDLYKNCFIKHKIILNTRQAQS